MKSVFVRVLCIAALSVLVLVFVRAEKQAISREQAEALVAGLKYQEGEIILQNGLATLRVPNGFGFLNGPDAQTVLEKLWGNPPRPSSPLGMLIPRDVSPLSENSWAVVVTYEADGYVSDKEAAKINYAELLGQMQKDLASANEEPQKAGYEPIQLVGWAEAPRYDSQTHKLYLAKEQFLPLLQ
jgi:uncharacterized membrane-anchored protein